MTLIEQLKRSRLASNRVPRFAIILPVEWRWERERIPSSCLIFQCKIWNTVILLLICFLITSFISTTTISMYATTISIPTKTEDNCSYASMLPNDGHRNPSSMHFNTIRAISSDWRLSYSVPTMMTMSWAFWLQSTEYWEVPAFKTSQPRTMPARTRETRSAVEATTQNLSRIRMKQWLNLNGRQGGPSKLATSRPRWRWRGHWFHFRSRRWAYQSLLKKQRGQVMQLAKEKVRASQLYLRCT